MIYIFGGGTVNYVRSHFALSAPAYGNTARALSKMLTEKNEPHTLILTKMADYTSALETNADVEHAVAEVLADLKTTAIVFNVALCDFTGQIGTVPSGRYAERLQTRDGNKILYLHPAKKLLASIKQARPDITVVGFKTTAGEDEIAQLNKMKRQIDETGVDFVIGNDTVTRRNILMANHSCITSTYDRDAVLKNVVNRLTCKCK